MDYSNVMSMYAYGEEIFFPVVDVLNRFVHSIFFSKNLNLQTEFELDENVKDMLEYQKGDEQAFLRIYNRNKRKVYSWAYRMLGNESVAEEISQEVFIRIMRSQKNYKPTAKFTTFLYTITSRLVFNESRRKSRRPEDDIVSDQLPNTLDLSNDSAHFLEKAENKHILENAMLQIPERQRAALMFRYIEGMSHDEIAAVMELKTQAVKSLLHRGLQSLLLVLEKKGVSIQ